MPRHESVKVSKFGHLQVFCLRGGIIPDNVSDLDPRSVSTIDSARNRTRKDFLRKDRISLGVRIRLGKRTWRLSRCYSKDFSIEKKFFMSN